MAGTLEEPFRCLCHFVIYWYYGFFLEAAGYDFQEATVEVEMWRIEAMFGFRIDDVRELMHQALTYLESKGETYVALSDMAQSFAEELWSGRVTPDRVSAAQQLLKLASNLRGGPVPNPGKSFEEARMLVEKKLSTACQELFSIEEAIEEHNRATDQLRIQAQIDRFRDEYRCGYKRLYTRNGQIVPALEDVQSEVNHRLELLLMQLGMMSHGSGKLAPKLVEYYYVHAAREAEKGLGDSQGHSDSDNHADIESETDSIWEQT